MMEKKIKTYVLNLDTSNISKYGTFVIEMGDGGAILFARALSFDIIGNEKENEISAYLYEKPRPDPAVSPTIDVADAISYVLEYHQIHAEDMLDGLENLRKMTEVVKSEAVVDYCNNAEQALKAGLQVIKETQKKYHVQIEKEKKLAKEEKPAFSAADDLKTETNAEEEEKPLVSDSSESLPMCHVCRATKERMHLSLAPVYKDGHYRYSAYICAKCAPKHLERVEKELGRARNENKSTNGN